MVPAIRGDLLALGDARARDVGGGLEGEYQRVAAGGDAGEGGFAGEVDEVFFASSRTGPSFFAAARIIRYVA